MVTIGEQLQLSRRLGAAIGTHRASILSTWLRISATSPASSTASPPKPTSKSSPLRPLMP